MAEIQDTPKADFNAANSNGINILTMTFLKNYNHDISICLQQQPVLFDQAVLFGSRLVGVSEHRQGS